MFEEKIQNLRKINPGLSRSIETLKEIIENFHIESLKRELKIIERYSSENNFSASYIDVVVLGQFKAGKSSLINNIIDENILPVGVIPVTSIVTRLQYGELKKAVVRFINGSSIKPDFSKLDEFITESKNPKNYKNVEIVEIFLPQLINFENIRIVDTPGIGSFFKNNSETTLQWLPEIGLALITISVERPLAEEDITLLKSVSRYAANTKIVLTKTDLISPEQLSEVKEYIENSLSQANFISNSNNYLQNQNQKLEILSYSIKKDSEENRKTLEEKVFIPIKEDFSWNFENIFKHKLSSLFQSCLSYLKVGLESNRKTEEEKEDLKHKIIDEQLKYQIIKNNLDIITGSFKNSNRETVSNTVMFHSKRIREKLESDFPTEFNLWKGNLYKISRKFESWLQNSLKELLLEAGEKSIINLNYHLKDIQDHFDLFASSFAERLNDNVERVLGIKLNNPGLHTEVERIKQPDISVSYSFDIHIDLLWFLFPMFIFRKTFQKFFFKKISYEVEKNLSRLTSDIAENISKIIDNNKKIITGYIHDELLTIENIIKNRKYESNAFKNAIEEIQRIEIN